MIESDGSLVNLNELKKKLSSLVAKMEEELPFASAYASSKRGKKAHASQVMADAAIPKPVEGVTLTGFTGRFFIEKSTTDISAATLDKMADSIIFKAKEEMKKGGETFEIDPGDNLIRDFAVECETDLDTLKLDYLMKEATTWRDKIPQHSEYIVNCGSMVGYEVYESLYVNRNRVLYQKLPRWDVMYYAVMAKNGATLRPYGGECLHGGPENSEKAFANMAERFSKFEKILGAPRIPNPGIHRCVISPGVSGLLAHEAFGHGTETDMYLKKRAKGASFVNKQVAAPGVSMLDSPALNGLPGSYFFDDEGMLARETVIIDDGILVNGLSDLNSATQLNIPRSPNGRRENFGHKTYARMTNTYFGEGTDTVEDMVSEIENGYLIDIPNNGMEDPKGWGVQCEMQLAREIKDGVLTDNYFTPVIMTGYVPEILKSITKVGKGLDFFTLGACGKGKLKELVKVSYGGPWLSLTARIA